MKKSLTASLVLVLLLSLAACGGSDGDGDGDSDGEDVPHSGINPVRCDVAPSHCA